MNNDKTFWIGQVILFIVAVVGLVMVVQPVAKASEELDTFDYVNATAYLGEMKFTDSQIKSVLDISDRVEDKDHFIMWFGAINRHEVGGTFIDGETNYLAGRLKKTMYGKDFDTQLLGRVNAYNRFWYKHDTTYGWLTLSRYCVSDTHGGGEGCPNWQVSVPALMSKYGKNAPTTASRNKVETIKNDVRRYSKAKESQEKLNALESETKRLWKECILSGECKNGE